jgi:hypothetical protein
MDRDEGLISHWSELLTVDGATPPPPLVVRCAAVFGPSPDFVLCQQLHEQGTRWKVAVLTANLFGCAEAHSAHPHWDTEAYVHQLGHDDGATYDCWATSVRDISQVGTLPIDDDGQHWRILSTADGGGLLSAWRIQLRNGTGINLPFGELPTAVGTHERAEEIAIALLKSLSL